MGYVEPQPHACGPGNSNTELLLLLLTNSVPSDLPGAMRIQGEEDSPPWEMAGIFPKHLTLSFQVPCGDFLVLQTLNRIF